MTNYFPFYHPYASFTGAQDRLLKVMALCFDHLHLPDLEEASVRTIGVGEAAQVHL